MRYMVQNYLLGNAYDTYSERDLINGFYGEVAQKINSGNFQQGAYFSLTNVVTPVVNDLIGSLASQQLKIKPGGTDLAEIGQLQYLNGVSYLNRTV